MVTIKQIEVEDKTKELIKNSNKSRIRSYESKLNKYGDLFISFLRDYESDSFGTEHICLIIGKRGAIKKALSSDLSICGNLKTRNIKKYVEKGIW